MVEIGTRCRIPICRDVWTNSMACHSRATCHIAGCCHLANSMSWSQSYVSHCRVLPLGEFTVMIPQPNATLQGAVTWRNQCHNRATLRGVIIPSAILKVVFRHILFFYFLMRFGLLRAAAFVSSPIHLFFCRETAAYIQAARTALAIVWCLPVSLESIAFVYCVKVNKNILNVFTLSGRFNFLDFPHQNV